MLNMPDIRTSIVLKKLIIVSMCEIFKDIVPSYKIRPWTEKENEQNVMIFLLNVCRIFFFEFNK